MGTVIIVGSLITDLVARAPRMPLPGESLIGDEFGTFLGGKGFNQAVAAARSGANVTLIGRVGSDTFGDAFFPVLAQEHVQGSFVTRDPTAGTGIACITVATDTGQNAIVVLPRANLAVTSASVEEALHTVSAQRPLPRDLGVFLAQCETNLSAVRTGLQLARHVSMTTILNVAPIPREPIPDDLFALVDILVVNETEAVALTGMAVDSPSTAQAAIEQLILRGSKHVIITLGASGSIWCERLSEDASPKCESLKAFSVTQVDATAAGDAFCGALAAGLAAGMQVSPALYRASAAGAVTATRMGAFASLPTAKEIEALMKKGG